MQVTPAGIDIRPLAESGPLLENSNGWGIFVKCRFGQMQIGAILPCGDGQHLRNITILAEMEVLEYEPCDFSDFYKSFEAAADAARNFLEAKRR